MFTDQKGTVLCCACKVNVNIYN